MRYILFIMILLAVACQKTTPEEIPLPTEVCIQTFHHHNPIPNASIYLKYNADSFPGYDKGPEYYDAVFYTGPDARGCKQSVPEGTHWVVAFGYDSLYFPHDVWGSVKINIDLTNSPKVDTLLYISEEH